MVDLCCFLWYYYFINNIKQIKSTKTNMKRGAGMLAIERRNEILERLQKEKRVVVSELSQLYQVTEETIRRDLEKLENDGLAIKSGGAVLNEQNIFGLPFDIRKNQCVAEKQKIAALAAGLVNDGDSVMLDVSSTAVYVVKELKKKEKLTVITNSVDIIVELYDMPGWTVISTGGTLVATGGAGGARSFALGGPHTDEVLASYHVDKAIVSCKGLDLESGITDYVEQDASSKRMMLRAARERILAADYTKFDTTAFTFERQRIECVF